MLGVAYAWPVAYAGAGVKVPTPFLPDRFELETTSEGAPRMRILGIDHEDLGALRKEPLGGIRGLLSQRGGYSVVDASGARVLSLARKSIGWFDLGIWRVAEACGTVVGWVVQTKPPGDREPGAVRLEDAFRAPVGELEWEVGLLHAEVDESVVTDARGSRVMTMTRQSLGHYSVSMEPRAERPLLELGIAATILVVLDPGVAASLPWGGP